MKPHRFTTEMGAFIALSSVIFPVCFSFFQFVLVLCLLNLFLNFGLISLLSSLFMNGALYPRIILVLTGACLFVMPRKSCLKFSHARSELESLKHSWKE